MEANNQREFTNAADLRVQLKSPDKNAGAGDIPDSGKSGYAYLLREGEQVARVP